MSTYTIALAGDLLIACVPEGGDIDAAIKAGSDAAGIDIAADDLTFVSGVTLTDQVEDGDKVIYSGFSCGWLLDMDGKAYEYAVKR